MKSLTNVVILTVVLISYSVNFFSVRATGICLLFSFLYFLFNYRKIRVRLEIVISILVVTILPIIFTGIEVLYFNYYLKYIITIFTFLTLIVSINNNKEEFEFALKLFLIISVVFFFLQVAVYLVFDFYIDYNYYIREIPVESMYQDRSLKYSFIPIRATGFFSEPSFYVMSVLPASFYFLNKRVYALSISGFISICFSLSLAGIATSIICVGIFVFRSSGNFKLKCLLVVFLASFSILISTFVLDRINNNTDYDAVGSRLVIFNEFKVRSDYYNILGAGILLDDSKPFGTLKMKGSNVRDSSFYLYMFFSLGIVGVLVFSCSMFIILGLSGILFLAPILILKYHILLGMFWISVAISYQIRKTS